MDTDTSTATRTIYVSGVTHPRLVVAALSPSQLSDVINGRARINNDRTLDLAIWNAAIDRENGYDA